MKAEQLIGKKAIRTRHTTYAGGGADRSFMERPIIILYANESHIIYERTDSYMKGQKNLLSYEYCDNNWINYDCLMFMAEKPRNNATIYYDEVVKVA